MDAGCRDECIATAGSSLSSKRTGRVPNSSQAERRDLKKMLDKIVSNDEDTVVFKIKNHIMADVTSEVLDTIIESFYRNTVCQALYVQNLPNAMQDEQVLKLLALLKHCSVLPQGCEPGQSPSASPSSSSSSSTVSSKINEVSADGSTAPTCHRCGKIRPASCSVGAVRRRNTCHCVPIWCLNIGESDNVSTAMWNRFCSELAHTSITHLYVSEHTIPLELKNRMRDVIRTNRAQHSYHSDVRNLEVIQRCTNMWWNPINSIKHAAEAVEAAKRRAIEEKAEAKRLREWEKEQEKERERRQKEKEREKLRLAKQREKEREAAAQRLREERRRRTLDVTMLTPDHVEYWWLKAQGEQGGGESEDDGSWKFNCSCGETCSSYENYRYHPTGLMFECANKACRLWSHARCAFGEARAQSTLDAATVSGDPLYCHKCKASLRRARKRGEVAETDTDTGAVESSSEQAADIGQDAGSKAAPDCAEGAESSELDSPLDSAT